ncbi:hypothetical protein J4710_03380 [Staphylococcus xylosus]|uniref:Uncharacterized protein n=1 Tax=Staphylococcus xylosus TaxID=1288 RepID=A0A939SJY4_STAXY|nr:hypothetical protein [Staphylococcus xylosus]
MDDIDVNLSKGNHGNTEFSQDKDLDEQETNDTVDSKLILVKQYNILSQLKQNQLLIKGVSLSM